MLQDANKIGKGNLSLLVEILETLNKGKLAEEAKRLELEQMNEAEQPPLEGHQLQGEQHKQESPVSSTESTTKSGTTGSHPPEVQGSGIVLVDTPGVDIVSGQDPDPGLWEAYGTRAVTAVFVLDGYNMCVGKEIQPQIHNLIRSFSTMPDEAAIFAINKWDFLECQLLGESSNDSDQVLQDEYNRRCDFLKKAWPPLAVDNAVDNQVIRLKAKQALSLELQDSKDEKTSDDCTKLLSCLEGAVSSSLATRVKEYTEWLLEFLREISEILSLQTVERFKDGLLKCEIWQDIVVQMRGQFNIGTKHLARKLREFLQTNREELVSSWNPTEDQLRDISGFDDLEALVRHLVVGKMRDILREWEKKTKSMKQFEDKIVSEFQDQFFLVKSELERILPKKTDDDAQPAIQLPTIDSHFVLHDIMFKSLPTGIAAMLNAMLFPFAIGMGVLGKIREKKEYAGTGGNEVFDQRRGYVRRKLNTVLTEVLNKQLYYNIINDCCQSTLHVDDLANHIPEIKSYLEKKIDDIERNNDDDNNQWTSRLPDVRTDVLLFNATEVRSYSLQVPRDIFWNGRDLIGEGSLSKVYRGRRLTKDGPDVEVEVCVPMSLKDVIEDYQREEEILTKLNDDCIVKFFGNDCIVKFFGTAIDRHTQSSTVQLVMVFERCNCTLREKLQQMQEGGLSAPASCTGEDRAEALLFAADMAKQTARALCYLHGKKLVHGDLNLDNIFLAQDDNPDRLTLKLAYSEVGIVKCERFRKQETGAEAPAARLYMAPEVLMKSASDRKVDMYSFAFVLWELWYGRQADHGNGLSDDDFCSEVVQRKLRPALTEDLPSDWMTLIQRCWEGEANMRPTAEECLNSIAKIICAAGSQNVDM
ncbi:uncharacterized protein LOC118432162 [Branchiostoma floridae]|uniref:Uncharacterized protein LOC118432162 n=1 Tax=Branchiostoma floridae TaxID=7739 RepID=A0A9J7MF29_BRAFL|nr:uncharacterized protein LOC118432162 [Branchiostoma floridae]